MASQTRNATACLSMIRKPVLLNPNLNHLGAVSSTVGLGAFVAAVGTQLADTVVTSNVDAVALASIAAWLYYQ